MYPKRFNITTRGGGGGVLTCTCSYAYTESSSVELHVLDSSQTLFTKYFFIFIVNYSLIIMGRNQNACFFSSVSYKPSYNHTGNLEVIVVVEDAF